MISSKADILQEITRLHNSTSQDASNILGSLIPKIGTKEIALHEVVEALSTSLTHTSPTQRGAGTRFLADILHEMPRDKLSHEEIVFLTAFFVDRMKDHHSVTPNVIYALLGLIEQDQMGKEEVVSLLRGIFRDVYCQSQIMSDRRNIYTFFKHCLTNKIEAVQELGSDFVLGFITAMDGEKDPRNLVLLFVIFPTVVKCLPLAPFTEELFEVVAAYFPIDFVPPADDPFGISAEDLVLGLRQALSSSSSFAPFCIPLIQEKLDSDLTSAKLDALHTLVSCCDVYSAEDIRPHVPLLWVSIRREVVEGSSAEAESAALSALTAIMKALERGSVSQAAREAAHSLTTSALMECLGHLTAPEQRLMYPSAHLLIAIMVSAPGPAKSISEKVLPLLADQFSRKTEETARKNTITILAKFIERTAKYPELKDGIFKKYESVCWEAFSQGLSCNCAPVQEATVTALTSTMSAFSSEHLSQAANTMTSLLMITVNDNLRDCIIRSFVALSKVQPGTVSDHILPQLLNEMEQGNSRNCGVTDSQILETLAILTSGKLLLMRVLPVLWRRAEEILNTSAEHSRLHLSCIQKILSNTMKDCECQKYVVDEWRGITKVVGLSAEVIVCRKLETPLPVLQSLSGISRTIVTHMKDSKPVIESVIQLLLSVEKENLSALSQELISAHSEIANLMCEFANKENSRASLLVYVFEGIILGLHRNTAIEGLEQLLAKLRYISLNGALTEERETASVLHASVINKMPLGPTFDQIVLTTSEELNAALEATHSTENRLSALQALTWTCKAFVLRGAQEEKIWTEKMHSLLCDACIGQKAAQSFEVILKEHDYALQPQTFANIRLLYKQRYFENAVGPLVDTFDNTTGSTKQNALLAVSSLLPHLPSLVLGAHIKRLLPVLLQGVTSGASAVRETTLSTLATLLEQSALHAAPHTSTLVPNLLALTLNQPLGVRMKSLECLKAVASLPSGALLPYRHDVTRGLRPVLNDKKRVVRQAAVNARSVWLLVGAPGSS